MLIEALIILATKSYNPNVHQTVAYNGISITMVYFSTIKRNEIKIHVVNKASCYKKSPITGYHL